MEKETYFDKTLAGWLGKNIGGTLGGPWEGQTCPLFLYDYDPVPTEPMPNDDFELQLVWLDMIRKKGIFITPADFVEYWLHHTHYNIAEYFNGRRNMSLGLLPPVTGSFNNWWHDGMGAAIRSEIWGMIAPGAPEIAAAYAYMDASTDHCGDGVFCEMFLSAVESLAYIEPDPWRVIASAKSFVPKDSVLSEVIDFVFDELHKGTNIRSLRHLLCAKYAHPTDFTYAPLNVAFIILGWLSSPDYSEALCNAVNCGYDTDCTGATLGAILGIQKGRAGIPEKWLKPIGTIVKVSNLLVDVEIPEDIHHVTQEVCSIGEMIIANKNQVKDHLFKWTNLPFLKDEKSKGVMPNSSEVVIAADDEIKVDVNYNDVPVWARNGSKHIRLNITALKQKLTVRLDLADKNGNTLTTSLNCDPLNTVTVSASLHNGLWKADEISREIPLVVSFDDHTIEASFSIPASSLWFVSKPLPINNLRSEQDEALLRHDKQLGWKPKWHPFDDLRCFVPEPDFIRYLLTFIYASEETDIRLIANNTGPIRVFLNDELVISKTHWLPGIMPSWHLQDCNTHLLPKKAGWADVMLRAGWNPTLIRLEGATKPQDVTFHYVRIKREKGNKQNAFLLPVGLHNTSVPPEYENWLTET